MERISELFYHPCQRHGQWNWVHPWQVSLRTLNCAVWLTHWVEGLLYTGTMVGLRGGPIRTAWQPMRISWCSTRSRTRSYTWVRAVQSTNTDWVVNKSKIALRRRTWESLWWKTQRDPAVYTCNPEGQPHPGLHQKQCDQRVENWGGSSPLVHSCETRLKYCVQL